MNIPKQYPGVRSYRRNPRRVIVIAASDTPQATAYDNFWLKQNDMDEESCTYFTYCLVCAIKKTTGNVTNYRLVEMIDDKLESLEKLRKRKGGPTPGFILLNCSNPGKVPFISLNCLY
jgi:hypothetical protein